MYAPKKALGVATAVATLVISLGGCVDDLNVPSAPIATPPTTVLVASGTAGPRLINAAHSNSTIASNTEQRAGEVVARAIAMALAEPAVRQEIKRALATSAVREHKLHITSFLQGRGGNILTAAYKNAGITLVEFQLAMASLRELEFYMPVRGHRETWAGGPNVMLAIVIQKNGPVVGFQLDGSRVSLDRAVPPSTPTLVLTHIETVFAEQVRLNHAGVAALSCDVSDIQTLEQANRFCEIASGPGRKTLRTSPTVLSPAGRAGVRSDFGSDPNVIGLYATFLRVRDAHESWYEGQPEIEIHVTGKRNGPSGSPIDYQCAGEHAADAAGLQPGIRDFSYVFDMNDNFWQNSEVRILNGAQLDSLLFAEPAGFNVSMWEDDDGACIIRQKTTTLFQDAVLAASALARGVNAIRPAGPPDYAVLAGIIGELAPLILGDDAYIGLLVHKDSTSYAGTNPGNTHMIFEGATENGRATLVLKRTSRSATVTGPGTVAMGTSFDWTASSTGSSGTVTYSWSVNGEGVQSGNSNLLSYQNTGTSFELAVTASDASGVIGSSGMFVNVSGCTPPEIIC